MPLAGEIYYQVYPSSSDKLIDVILIHGAGGTSLHWPINIRRMAGCRVYAIDLPGHGKSKGHGFHTIEQYSAVISQWMLDMDILGSIIIGHSMGSAIAAQIHLNNPNAVSGLALIGSAAKLTVSPVLLEATQTAETFPRAVQMIINWSFSPNTSDVVVKQAHKRMLDVRYSVLHGDFLACNRFDISHRLHEITCPTLIICGDNDRMTPSQQSHQLAKRISNVVLSIVPMAGHMVMIEQAEQVSGLIQEFIHKKITILSC